MMRTSTTRPLVLMAAGLFGLAGFAATTRSGAPLATATDAARGAWVGVCLGLEVLAVILLRRARGASAR